MATNPWLAFLNRPGWVEQSAKNSAKAEKQKNPDAGFNSKPTIPGSRLPQAPVSTPKAPAHNQIPITNTAPGTVNLGTWEPQKPKPSVVPTTPAAKPAAPVAPKPTVKPPDYSAPKNPAPKPNASQPQGVSKWGENPTPTTPTTYKPGEIISGWGAAAGTQYIMGQDGQWKPYGSQPQQQQLQQQLQQLQVWNPQRPQQMSFQSGYQRPPMPQYAPPWMQYQQQPQWGGMSGYYNSMNPWGQMPSYNNLPSPQQLMPNSNLPSPQQMGFNANNAYGQFGGQWNSPFANRPTPSYAGPWQMPVVPNLPTQQPQYVQTPWDNLGSGSNGMVPGFMYGVLPNGTNW